MWATIFSPLNTSKPSVGGHDDNRGQIAFKGPILGGKEGGGKLGEGRGGKGRGGEGRGERRGEGPVNKRKAFNVQQMNFINK